MHLKFLVSPFYLVFIGIGYYAMTYSLEESSVWRWWISLNFCWFSTFVDILFLNTSWIIAQAPIKHYFLKEHDEVFQMDINKLLQ